MSENQWQRAEIESLEKQIEYHNYRYFVLNDPEISDEQFDMLVRLLKKLAPDSPVLHRVGAGATATSEPGQKVVHDIPMLSLDKCYNDLEFQAWVASVQRQVEESWDGMVTLTPKIDGVAASLRYGADGELLLAATRGDGEVGEEFTSNARMISGVPLRVAVGPLEVRGEVHMRRSIFQEKYASQFANPRNLAAGSLKQKEGNLKQLLDLDFLAYDLLMQGRRLDETEKSVLLQQWGFKLPPIWIGNAALVPERYRSSLEERQGWEFETDGIVIKVVGAELQEKMGSTAHHPRWAIAYKFQGDAGLTTLEGVEWSLSRTGSITPVALIAPVSLSGATVSRCSLHNISIFRQHSLHVGDQVEVVRRGGVIPNLERSLGGGTGGEVAVPLACPSCGAPTLLAAPNLFVGGFRVPRWESRIPPAVVQSRRSIAQAKAFGPVLSLTEDVVLFTGDLFENTNSMRSLPDQLRGMGAAVDQAYSRTLGWSSFSFEQGYSAQRARAALRAAPRASSSNPGLMVVAAGDTRDRHFRERLEHLAKFVEADALDLRLLPTFPVDAQGALKADGLKKPQGRTLFDTAPPSKPDDEQPWWILADQTQKELLKEMAQELAGGGKSGFGRFFLCGIDVTPWVKTSGPWWLPDWMRPELESLQEALVTGDSHEPDEESYEASASSAGLFEERIAIAVRASTEARRLRIMLPPDEAPSPTRNKRHVATVYRELLTWSRALSEENIQRSQAIQALLHSLPSYYPPNATYAALCVIDPLVPATLSGLREALAKAHEGHFAVAVLPAGASRLENIGPQESWPWLWAPWDGEFWRWLQATHGIDLPAAEGLPVDGELVPDSFQRIQDVALSLSDGVLQCSQPEGCPAAVIGTLVYFAKTLGMEGFGPEVVTALFQKGLLLNRSDFFKLTSSSFTGIERFGEILAAKLVAQVESVRKVGLALFLESLGVPELGRQFSRLLEKECRTMEAVLGLTEQDLLDKKRFPGIELTTAVTLIAGLRKQAASISELLEHIEVTAPAAPPELVSDAAGQAENQVRGRSFVFTGTLKRAGRREAQAVVLKLGGTAPADVTKELDYLVAGEEERVSSKLTKAQANIKKGSATKIISEEQFWEMVEPHGTREP